jgi:hypothetical protein
MFEPVPHFVPPNICHIVFISLSMDGGFSALLVLMLSAAGRI